GSATLEAPVLFGTDGAGSVVRSAVLAARGETASETALAHGHKELTLPPMPNGDWRLERPGPHIWHRGDFIVNRLPNADGSFTCTLFLACEGSPSFATLEAPGALRDFFRAQFPDIEPFLPDLEAEFEAHPTGTMVTVKSPAWYAGDSALLLGD